MLRFHDAEDQSRPGTLADGEDVEDKDEDEATVVVAVRVQELRAGRIGLQPEAHQAHDREDLGRWCGAYPRKRFT